MSKIRSLVKDEIFALEWFSKKFHFQALSKTRLAIAYRNGQIQLMESETDNRPKVIETELEFSALTFSPDGLYLCLCGTKNSKPAVDFYSVTGVYLRSLKISGLVKSLSWNRLRIAFGIESYIFFGNVRSNYLWGYCQDSKTLVYAFEPSYLSDEIQNTDQSGCIMFWNTKTGEQQVKTVSNANNMVADGDHVIVTTRALQSDMILFNSIGAEIERTKLPFLARHVAIKKNYAIAASPDKVFVWRLNISQKSQILNSMSGLRKTIEIDRDGSNEIVAVAISPKSFIVAQRKGNISRYTLPTMELESTYEFYGGVPLHIRLNCTSTRLSIIDSSALLYIIGIFSSLKVNVSLFSLQIWTSPVTTVQKGNK